MRVRYMLAGVAVVACGLPAAAQSPSAEMERMRRQMQDMQRQMEAMQRRLIELQTAQNTATEAARSAQRDAQAAQQMATGEAPVPPGRLANSFAVPGTNGRARMRVSGFAKANAQQDFDGRLNSDSVTASSAPLRNASAARQDGNLQASARRSRVRLESEIETGWDGEWRFSNQVIEFDFAGSSASGANVGTNNAYNPRLRLAFATLGPVMVGQNASLWQMPSAAMAERLDDGTFVGTSGVRQVGVRYTASLGGGFTGALALESPYSDVTNTAATNINNDNGQGSFTGSNNVPDLLAALDYRAGWGGASARGLLRQVKVDNQSASNPAERFTDSIVGWGIGFGAWLDTGRMLESLEAGSRLFGIVHYGQGIGRYLDGTSNGYSAASNFGLPGVSPAASSLNAVDVLTGMIGYRHVWVPGVRSNIVYGVAALDHPSFAERFTTTAGNTNDLVQQFSLNLIWSPRPWIDTGIEYIYATRDVLNSTAAGAGSGQVSRIQLSFTGRF